MAFGLYMSGCDTLAFDKLRIDLAFENAWRDWPHKSRYPQVNTDLSKGTDAVWVMTRADEKKRTYAFCWQGWNGGALTLRPRQHDWERDDPNDVEFAVSVIDDHVPLAGWLSLAQQFLSELNR
ncbi:hypothetical protein SAMN04488580_10533 [Mycobacterium sp. 283mftsu]|nr:hypothetical protein SAMN04488580_10533 [Mycobacterium sp. 283mftsu]